MSTNAQVPKHVGLLVLFLVLLPSTNLKAQTADSLMTKKEIRKARPFFLDVGLGSNFGYFRDFATSPLTYTGSPLFVAINTIKEDYQRQSTFGFAYSYGNYFTDLDFEGNSLSVVNGFFTDFSHLRQLKKWSNEQWNTQIGGSVNMTWLTRENQNLLNNSFGADNFNTLFGSLKINRDISRSKQKEHKILFIKYKLKPKQRALSYRFNLGLINAYLRNGFAYTGQSGLINNFRAFDNHQFDIFKGFRMSSTLEYRVYAPNGNAYKLAYLWDAFRTSDEIARFEVASHVIKFSLSFKTN